MPPVAVPRPTARNTAAPIVKESPTKPRSSALAAIPDARANSKSRHSDQIGTSVRAVQSSVIAPLTLLGRTDIPGVSVRFPGSYDKRGQGPAHCRRWSFLLDTVYSRQVWKDDLGSPARRNLTVSRGCGHPPGFSEPRAKRARWHIRSGRLPPPR
jgi:hypothetical protein